MVILKLTLHDENAKKMLREIERRGGNLMPAMKRAAIVLMRSAGRQFHVGGIPKWRALSDVTVERRRKKSDVPLRDSGTLMRSWSGRGGQGVRDVKKFSVFVGSNLVYAGVHQYGRRRMRAHVPETDRRITTVFGRRIESKMVHVRAHETTLPRIPKRPVRILPEDVEDVEVIVTDYILGK